MLAYLLYFQFPFVYLLALTMGLVVYGSDFDGISGWLYVLPLILYAVIHKRVWRMRFKLDAAGRLVWIVGAVTGLVVYAPLHMHYWDEHSISQALWIALLGTCSYATSVMAAARVIEDKIPVNRGAAALAFIGLAWLTALQYPMAVFFFLALLFILAAIWVVPMESAQREQPREPALGDPIAKYTIFMVVIDISCVIWDFEVNTQWALYIALAFFAAAAGFYTRHSDFKSDKLEQTVYIVAAVNFIAAVIWPPYLLWVVHGVVVGFCLGYLLPAAMASASSYNPGGATMGWIGWFFWAMVLSNAWYANLQWAASRLIVALPFVLLAMFYLRFKISVSRYHA